MKNVISVILTQGENLFLQSLESINLTFRRLSHFSVGENSKNVLRIDCRN